jgi:hypothetical protein
MLKFVNHYWHLLLLDFEIFVLSGYTYKFLLEDKCFTLDKSQPLNLIFNIITGILFDSKELFVLVIFSLRFIHCLFCLLEVACCKINYHLKLLDFFGQNLVILLYSS